MVQCIKVPLNKAEEVKKEFLSKNQINSKFFPSKGEEFIYFPVNNLPILPP